MNLRKIGLTAALLLGLIVVPLAIVLYFVAHLKGAPALAWPAIDLNHLDLGRLLDASGTADQTGDPGGAGGGAGGAGAGSVPTYQGEDPFSRGVREWAKRNLPEWLYDAIFGVEAPSGGSST